MSTLYPVPIRDRVNPGVILELQTELWGHAGTGVYGPQTMKALRHLSHHKQRQFVRHAERHPLDQSTDDTAINPDSADAQTANALQKGADAQTTTDTRQPQPFHINTDPSRHALQSHKHSHKRHSRHGLQIAHPELRRSHHTFSQADVAHAAVFDQRSGSLILPNGQRFDVGSGNHSGNNNPEMADRRNVGPIPPGLWHVAKVANHTFKFGSKPDGKPITDTTQAAELTPVTGTETFGRNGFFLHHRHSTVEGRSASQGCITSDDKQVREILRLRREGEFTQIYVTADMTIDPALADRRESLIESVQSKGRTRTALAANMLNDPG